MTKALQVTGLVLVALLIAVWPTAHTISLRDLLLALTLVVFGFLAVRGRPAGWWQRLEWPLGLYAVLTLWIFIVALFVSDETAWSLGEIRGQWLKGLLALLAGGMVALAIRRDPALQRHAAVIILVALFLHIAYVDYLAVKDLVEHGQLTDRIRGLTKGPDTSNYLTNILLVLLLAEVFLRITCRPRFLPLSATVLIVLILLTLFSVYAESVRNGVIELSFVLMLFAILFVSENRQRFGKTTSALVISALIVVPVAFAYLSYKTDERWQTFIDTIPLAMDTETNRQWINLVRQHELRLPDGRPVDWSNYMRMARIKAGVDLTIENPLGVGFGRNAFGHAVMKKYGESSSHSHSGLIDLAVGTGVPGTLLWLGFLASLMTLAWRSFRKTSDYCALALLFLVTGYGIRMVLDSIIRDHMLQMFLFLAAFLAVIAAGQLARQRALAAAPPG